MTKCLVLLSHENNLYRDEPFFQRLSWLGFGQNDSSASSYGAALCGDLLMGEARRWCMMMSLSYSLNSSASLCKLRHCHPRRHCSHQDRNVFLHKKGTRNKFALIFNNTLSTQNLQEKSGNVCIYVSPNDCSHLSVLTLTWALSAIGTCLKLLRVFVFQWDLTGVEDEQAYSFIMGVLPGWTHWLIH